MHTKLTLRLSDHLIGQAKKRAQKNGKSLSQMVADYFRSLTRRLRHEEAAEALTPLVAALKGSLRGSKVGLKEYRRHLKEKFR